MPELSEFGYEYNEISSLSALIDRREPNRSNNSDVLK